MSLCQTNPTVASRWLEPGVHFDVQISNRLFTLVLGVKIVNRINYITSVLPYLTVFFVPHSRLSQNGTLQLPVIEHCLNCSNVT